MDYKIIIVSISVFFCAISLPAANASTAPPDYSIIRSHLYELAEKNPQTASVIEYGKSIQGRPLVALRIAKKAYVSEHARPALLVTGVTHGHEYLNIVDQLPQWVLSSKQPLAQFINNGGLFYIIPIFNPDGYTAIDRYNSNQVDLNRDFTVIPTLSSKFTQPETALFARFLEKDLSEQKATLVYAMSYHCCGRGETENGWGDTAEVGYPWGYTKNTLPADELAKFKKIGERISQAFDNRYIQVGAWSKILYSVQGVATDYYYAKYGAMSFVFEGKENYEAQRIHHHFRMWQALAEQALNHK